MSGGNDKDDGLDEVLDQVEDALAELGIEDAATTRDVLESVRDALQEALPPGADPPRPARPKLTVVDPGESFPRQDPPPAAPEDAPRHVAIRRARVRVLDRGARAEPAVDPRHGTIELRPTEGETAEQPVLAAAEARAYRVRCASGRLRIVADGAAAGVLAAGQAMDLEARIIRVLAREDTRGTFERIG
jgi:hypothetical protein